ncbi:putative membrane protein [Microbacterium sp. SORGH_AS 888]|nr:putative membrane protein [Microbacterium sp. SORGH_AS_0888]
MRIVFPSPSLRLALADAASTPPERVGARLSFGALLGASPLRLAVLSLTVLLTGIGISIATTTDPLWWHLHFSRLGTFRNGSGAFFNGTLIAGGTLVTLFARAAARELRKLERRVVRRGTARTAGILFGVVGIDLALVGCVPLNVNKTVHDHVAAAMVLGFAGLLVTSPWMMHRMPKRLLATTGAVFAYLFAGAWLFVTAAINLALFEVVAFSAMFSWSGVFVLCLLRAGSALTGSTAQPAAAGTPGAVRAVPARVSAPRARAARACSTDAPRDRRRPAPRRRHDGRPAAHVHPRRGCTASAAPAASRR